MPARAAGTRPEPQSGHAVVEFRTEPSSEPGHTVGVRTAAR
ncbi:hypothetical protein [Arthrobacter sp. ov118]|nr:hypothetical protein [Arthrobacter sp. ov118]